MAKYLDMTGLTYLISKLIALINAKSDKNHTHNYLSGLSVSGKTITYTKGDGTSGTITTQDTNTTYNPATTSANGLMSSTDKAKLDAITESADAVSVTQKLTSGTEIGTVTINGTGIKLYAPTNTDTHYASKNVVGSSTATNNTTTALTNGNVYLNSVENGAVTSTHKISGTGATTVTTDASGNIIINSTDTSTTYTHPTTSGNKHIPSGGSSGQFLKWSADGTATWATDNNTTYSAGTGISLSGTTFSNSGVRSIASGSTNGTISVNTNGTSTDVAVKGLGSAAYTASTAYATSGHTHNYAGSSSAGGAATTALTCTGNSATATNSDMLDGLHADDFQKSIVNLADKTNVLDYADNSGETMFTYRISHGYNEPFAENKIGSGDYYYYAYKINDDLMTLIAIDINSSNMYIRNKSDEWDDSWRCISDDGNADTVDGYHASDFVKTGYKNTVNWNTITDAGVYRMDDITAQTTYINGMNGFGQLIVAKGNVGDTIAQIYCNYNDNQIFSRTANGVGGSSINWTSWSRFYTSSNITYDTYALTPGSSGLTTGNIYLQYE